MERSLEPLKKEPVFLPSTFTAPSPEELLEDVQGAIVQAFEARSEYVRQKATTLTLASFRWILEKDLNVETGFLETYKEFVTGLIIALLQGPEEESPEMGKVSDEHGKGKEKSELVESKPIYSRKVEHSKNIMKDCGITVTPCVYNKAKQAGESRQEDIMIAKLEAILRKEGLTASASNGGMMLKLQKRSPQKVSRIFF